MLDPACLLGCSESHVSEYDFGGKLIPEVFDQFQVLVAAAQKEGFDLTIASAYRSFDRQLVIWNDKASGLRPVFDVKGAPLDIETLSDKELMMAVLRWSALPGASRHHWGTDFDIYDAAALKSGQALQLTVEETAPGGPFFEMYRWLNEYLAASSVFFRPYAKDLGGVAPEPWHISYRPLATRFLAEFNQPLFRDLITQCEMRLKDVVLQNLDELYERFILNISDA